MMSSRSPTRRLPQTCKGIAFQSGDQSHERLTLLGFAAVTNMPYRILERGETLPDGWLPSGTVQWVEEVAGFRVLPESYPSFASAIMFRDTWFSFGRPTHREVFIKPANRYKDYPSRIASLQEPYWPDGPYWCSDVIPAFVNEWRYYITDGRVIYSRWYKGDESECDSPAPELPIRPPSDWSGTLDLGRTIDGRLALIEAHHPFSCGWYGRTSESEVYAHWLWLGWRQIWRARPNSKKRENEASLLKMWRDEASIRFHVRNILAGNFPEVRELAEEHFFSERSFGGKNRVAAMGLGLGRLWGVPPSRTSVLFKSLTFSHQEEVVRVVTEELSKFHPVT